MALSNTTLKIAIASYGKADSRSNNHKVAEMAVAMSSRMTRASENLRKKLPPRRHGRFRFQLITAVAFESGFRLGVGQALFPVSI